MTAIDTIATGWKWFINSSKAHYIGLDGRSLCGKWLSLSNAGIETGNDDSPDNCRACRRNLKP